MRALCGAIITAGAVIGLGMTAIGIGTRYTRENAFVENPTTKSITPFLVKLSDMDKPLVFILVFLTAVTLVGLGISFVGLAYHHARREREHTLEKDRAAAHHRTAV